MSQVLETRWTANIPFDFIVGGDHQMPAGEYTIKSNPHTMRLTLVNKETRQTASMFTRHVEKLRPDERTVLIFHSENGRHVLHQGAEMRPAAMMWCTARMWN